MISKEEFINILNFIKRKNEEEEKFVEALEKLSPSTYCDCFLYDEYESKIIDLLENIFKDNNHEIGYFLYDCNWLNGFEPKNCPKSSNNRYLYKSPETLYDYLVKEMKHEKI